MPEFITDLADPRVAIYTKLKDRDAVVDGRFIAEGAHLVRRLLASELRAESVFLAEDRVEEFRPLVGEGVATYVTTHALMNEIIGFKFHSGAMACGIKPPSRTIEPLLSRAREGKSARVVICPEISNAENLGAISRVAAGFGAEGLLVGERSTDPYFRRTLRVSMGTIFRLNVIESVDIASDIARLREAGVPMLATVLHPDAEPLNGMRPLDRFGLMLGCEAHGLPAEMVRLADRKVMIPMRLGTDSLNVAVAAGIFLHHLTGS